MWTQFRVAGGSIQSQLYQTIVDDCFDSTDPRSALKSFLSPIIFCFPQTSIHCILYLYLYFVWSCFDDTDPRRRLLWRAFTNYFLLFPDFHSSLEPIMTSSLSFTVSTLASPRKQYMIYANNFWRKKNCWTMHQVPKWNKSFDTNLWFDKWIVCTSLPFLVCICISIYVFEWMKQLLLESMYFSLLGYLYSRQHTLPLEKEIHKPPAPSHILGIERLSWRWSKSNNWICIWMKVRKVRKFESASETFSILGLRQ